VDGASASRARACAPGGGGSCAGVRRRGSRCLRRGCLHMCAAPHTPNTRRAHSHTGTRVVRRLPATTPPAHTSHTHTHTTTHSRAHQPGGRRLRRVSNPACGRPPTQYIVHILTASHTDPRAASNLRRDREARHTTSTHTHTLIRIHARPSRARSRLLPCVLYQHASCPSTPPRPPSSHRPCASIGAISVSRVTAALQACPGTYVDRRGARYEPC
jgi:hypothetical protein